MKIFSIQMDADHYQTFSASQDEEWQQLEMDCEPRAATWKPPEVFVYRPKLPMGDFLNCNSSAIVASPRAFPLLRPFFEAAGEVLPLPYKGQVYRLLNILVCVDAIDEEQAEYFADPQTGQKIYLTKYAFDASRLPTSPIFKLPQTSASDILLIEGRLRPEDEFRAIVEREGLKGLVFEELWSDDAA